MKTCSFEVVASHLEYFKERVEKFNRKATKLGIELLSCEFSEMWYRTFEIENTNRFYIKEFYTATVTFPDLKLNEEWELIGAIDNTLSINNYNFITPFSDVDLTEYMNVECSCEHCKRAMNRNKLFIIQDVLGNRKLVGSTCVRDFLGHDIKGALFMAGLENELMLSCGDPDDEKDKNEGARLEFAINAILGAIIFKQRRYYSTKKEEENGFSTAGIALDCIFEILSGKEKPFPIKSEEIDADTKIITENLNGLIEQMIFGKIENTFDQNIAIMAKCGYVPFKRFSLIAGYVGMWWIKNKDVATSDYNPKLSEYIGNEKEKVTIPCVVDKVVESNSSFGGYLVFGHIVDTNNKFMLYTTNKNEMFEVDRNGNITKNEGEFVLTATIKALQSHEIYGKTTVLSRGKVKNA
jgi:hypothetical protein